MNTKNLTILLLMAGLIVPAFAGTIYHVDDDAADGGDGLDWTTAFNDLQTALDAAQLDDEIRVAGGIYIPSVPATDPTFQLVNGVALRGGYAGGDGTNADDRDFIANETVLTGDLDGPNPATHVIFTSACQAGTILDGVTVTASGCEAMYNDPFSVPTTVATISNCSFRDNMGSAIAYGDLTITDCTFMGNHTTFGGGAMVFVTGTLQRCSFVGNSSEQFGGAMWFCDMAMTDCTFTGNTALSWGGAIEGLSPVAPITNCVFTENVASIGGAIHSLSGNQTFVNCVFARNQATGADPGQGLGGAVMDEYLGTNRYIQCVFVLNSAQVGGAVYSGDESTLDVVNCTLAGNTATSGNAFACNSSSTPGTLTITNSILWDGGSEIANNDGSTITVTYSDIQGGWTGSGNIDAPPLFVRMPSGTDHGDLRLTVGSPCVNLGNTAALPADSADLDGDTDVTEPLPLDLDNTRRVKGSVVDMGVYELAEVIPADVDLFPRILYKHSFFRWVTAFIGLPTEYNVSSIDTSTIAITKIENLCCPECPPLTPNQHPDPAFTPRILDCDWDGIPELVVKFKRQDLLDLLEPGFYRITVSGMLQTAEPFQGTETIIVIGHCN